MTVVITQAIAMVKVVFAKPKIPNAEVHPWSCIGFACTKFSLS